MNYILAMTTGEKFRISQDEAEKISLASDNQSITIKRLGMVIQKRMIQIYPEHNSDKLEDRQKQKTGILHDGTKAKNYFGQWVDYFDEVPDDNGNYKPIRLDPKYYPEVALDCVATEKEFDQIITEKKDYYEFLGIQDRIKRIGNCEDTGSESISNLLEEKTKQLKD